jgi:hypothetical protein
MAKAPRNMVFDLDAEAIRVGFGGRLVTIPVREGEDEDGDPVLVAEIDSLTEWSDGSEIELKDLQRLLEIVEEECARRDIEVEFE